MIARNLNKKNYYVLYIAANQYKDETQHQIITQHDLTLVDGHLLPCNQLDNFPRPGIYDWRIVEIVSETGIQSI